MSGGIGVVAPHCWTTEAGRCPRPCLGRASLRTVVAAAVGVVVDAVVAVVGVGTGGACGGGEDMLHHCYC